MASHRSTFGGQRAGIPNWTGPEHAKSARGGLTPAQHTLDRPSKFSRSVSTQLLKGHLMSTGRSMHSDSSWSCRRLCVVPLAGIIAGLCTASTSEAKPTIYITFCGSASGGAAPFYLYWGSTGTNNAPNYIWTYLYDVNGNLLSGYPVEDLTDYVISVNQTSPTCVTPTGAEADTASGAVTVVLNVSGDWNGNSTGSESCGARLRLNKASKTRDQWRYAGPSRDRSAAGPRQRHPEHSIQLPLQRDQRAGCQCERGGTGDSHRGPRDVELYPGPAGNRDVQRRRRFVRLPFGLERHGAGRSQPALNSLAYTPTTGYTGPDTLGILDKDTIDSLSAKPATFSITVNPPGPVITAPPSMSINVTASTAPSTTIPFSGSNAISLADSSATAGTNTHQMSLSVQYGTLSVGTLAGVGVSGTGTTSLPLVLAGGTAATNSTLILSFPRWSTRPPRPT